MRTLIMLGIAVSALVVAERAAAVELPMANSQVTAANGHKKGKEQPMDYGTGFPGNDRVYSSGADRYPVEGEYRRVDDVDYQGRWTGTWDGTYEAPDGRVYEGQYQGTYNGAAGTTYAPPPPRDPYADGYRTGMDQRYGYDPREDERMARLCRDDGLGGGVIGAVVGGVAGNRIAGRGNRTAGTLIGAGVGGIAGAVIDQSEDRKKCAAWRAARQGASHGGYPGGYYPGGAPAPYYPHGGAPQGGAYYQGGYGYGYYSPGVVVTTVITQPAPVVTETVTTTTTSYETVYVQQRQRHAPKKRTYKPRPKPRCGC
jgi:hypothetical protein